VIATFDSGDPFILEKLIGQGRLLVMTSSWQPSDSQLALSTKFVPMIGSLIERRDVAMVESQYAVGEPVALPASKDAKRVLHTPDGQQIELPASATTWNNSDRPGIYRVDANDQQYPLAVNVGGDESRTSPLAAADLEQFGARLGQKATPELAEAKSRQLQQSELENRQKLWRWLIIGVIGLVAMETVVAGRLTKRPSPS
jgi:hypothetical protein